MRQIAADGGPFIAFRDPGSHGIVQRLIRKTGVTPAATWLRLDDAVNRRDVVRHAAEQGAYVVVGHIPIARGRIPLHGMEVLLSGDPNMRRAYVVLTPGSRHPATPARRALAEAFADYLLSSDGQAALIRADHAAGGPWLFPRTWPALPPIQPSLPDLRNIRFPDN